jgi:hypothetical protein
MKLIMEDEIEVEEKGEEEEEENTLICLFLKTSIHRLSGIVSLGKLAFHICASYSRGFAFDSQTGSLLYL